MHGLTIHDPNAPDAHLAETPALSPTTKTRTSRDPLLIDFAGLSALLCRSRASLERDLSAGRLLRPIRLGRALRWRIAEVQAWIDAGAPSAAEWESRRKGARR